jgi:peroxiredoxin
MNPKTSPSLLRSLFSLIVLILASWLGGCAPGKSLIELKPGTPAPDFTLKAARGGSYHLKDMLGQTVLLSFLNTQADANAATPDQSRAQINFIKSMKEQYGPKGLNVFIVDAAQLTSGKQPSPDELINFTYNWQLDAVPVLIDENATVRDQFGILSNPTTLLIGKDGKVQQRWNSVASSSQLALAIETIVGEPVYRITATNATPTAATKSCPGEAPEQAKFSGLGLARSLSDDIWVVDQGKAWGVGGKYPLQWIILDNANKLEKRKADLQVTAHYFNTESFLLIYQALTLLPKDEARGLSGGQSSFPQTYFLTTNIILDKPGCLQVQAIVKDQETGATLYNGETFVTVQ